MLAAVTAVLLLAGTFWGQDDDFPFGPFRMYSTAPDPTPWRNPGRGGHVSGRVVRFTERNGGIRRAEIEGQQQESVADRPGRRGGRGLRGSQPGCAALARCASSIRWHGVRGSRPTGTWTDQVVADGWRRDRLAARRPCPWAASPPSVRSSTCSSWPTCWSHAGVRAHGNLGRALPAAAGRPAAAPAGARPRGRATVFWVLLVVDRSPRHGPGPEAARRRRSSCSTSSG